MRSVGYSDLFVLSKKDMWDVLKEYPAARVRLEAIAVKRLEKYKRTPLEKGGSSLFYPRAFCRIYTNSIYVVPTYFVPTCRVKPFIFNFSRLSLEEHC